MNPGGCRGTPFSTPRGPPFSFPWIGRSPWFFQAMIRGQLPCGLQAKVAPPVYQAPATVAILHIFFWDGIRDNNPAGIGPHMTASLKWVANTSISLAGPTCSFVILKKFPATSTIPFSHDEISGAGFFGLQGRNPGERVRDSRFRPCRVLREPPHSEFNEQKTAKHAVTDELA